MDWGGLFTVSFDWLDSIVAALGNMLLNVLQYLLNEVWQLIQWILSLLPALPVFPLALSAVSAAFAYLFNNLHFVQILNSWNYYVALNVGLAFAGTALIAEGAASAFHVLRWLLSKLPFIGGAE